MELGAQEWRDSLFLRYGINPPDLPSHYNGCGAGLSIYHYLDCNKCGLITECHNELCYGVSDLAGKAFTPAHMRDDPKIFTGCAVQGGEGDPKAKARRHRRRKRGRRRGTC